jgi:outer membrane receptor protein involved in Fe transport
VRVEPARTVSVDLAMFYNGYDDLIDFAAATPRFESAPVPHLLVPRVATNVGSGYTSGAELTVQWQVTRLWRLFPSYTYLNAPFLGTGFEFDYAPHRANLRSQISLPAGVELNTFISHVARLGAHDVPAYTRVDSGLTWQATDSLRIGIWGRNLLDADHLEARETSTPLRQVRRDAVAQIAWQFGRQ